jgi:hypothetical protein
VSSHIGRTSCPVIRTCCSPPSGPRDPTPRLSRCSRWPTTRGSRWFQRDAAGISGLRQSGNALCRAIRSEAARCSRDGSPRSGRAGRVLHDLREREVRRFPQRYLDLSRQPRAGGLVAQRGWRDRAAAAQARRLYVSSAVARRTAPRDKRDRQRRLSHRDLRPSDSGDSPETSAGHVWQHLERQSTCATWAVRST